ncbi:MAG: glycosyltransferase family 1 protein, partial [Spirochaetota bacterium]
DLPVPFSIDVLPEVGYTDPREPADDALARAASIERALTDRYADDDALWWVHNYHVGKNPALTLALCRIATLENAPRMLLHVHDFPECARYENLAYLTRVAGRSPYPTGANVRYAVINARDRRLLVEAGIPAERVGLLLNPVDGARGDGATASPDAPPTAAAAPDRERVVARLADYAADTGQRFHPDGPLVLYPVRTIRRKNVLEAAAITRLARGTNLIVTLPGVSDAERPYSDLVRYAYEDRRIHGIWGIAPHDAEYALSYEAVAAASDVVVSSSVQEGFGLLFVNALRWRKPLLARRLDVLESLQPLFSGYPATFYDTFRVPMRSPSITSMQAYLRMRYNERLGELEDVIPPVARERLDADLDELLAGEAIDFSYLPAQMQLTVLGDLREEGYGALVKAMNGELVSAVAGPEVPTAAVPPDREAAIADLLGYKAYAGAFAALWDGTDAQAAQSREGAARYEGVQDALVEAFARIGQLRLLLGPIDHDPHAG